MTREYESFLESSLAAERSGDAATALEYHRGIPMFTRGRHVSILDLLASLADEMTPWLWARWAAYQCNRAEDAGTESGFITRAALDYTLQMFYDDQMQAAYDEGRDPIKLTASVMGESWIYHQVCTFELGGLREFLDFVADGPLAEYAGWARSWDGAAMRGLRVESAGAGRLVATDLKTRREIEVLDLGAGAMCAPGGFLVGRLVDSGVTPAPMFDTTPGRGRPADRAGGRGVDARRLDHGLHQGAGRREARPVGPRERGPRAGLRRARAVVARGGHSSRRPGQGDAAAARGSRRGRAGGVPHPARCRAWRVRRRREGAYVGAAALNVHAYAQAEQTDAAGHHAAWLRWAELVPDPARARLLRLARLCGAAAAEGGTTTQGPEAWVGRGWARWGHDIDAAPVEHPAAPPTPRHQPPRGPDARQVESSAGSSTRSGRT